ncbi:pVI [Baboon adenovirus 3]|uniref:Pre-protein VI n=1 Tax=Simian mastadenovirus C TaxID=1962300 RepID=M9YZ73_9ADEN|nr:pVI [Baboon adenovirus 3]AGK27137.1 pVI [Baboon adenovirus 3]AGK27209.1 pVI [Simian mastadenovirus C]
MVLTILCRKIMEDINFSSLAPRHGSRPFMGTWNDIGTSQLNGGAFSWSSLWSGLKNFGSTIKTYGNKAWNSSTGQMLRDKLKDQNFQQKVVDGLASGINGVVDLANQAVQNQINQRLENSRVPPQKGAEVEEVEVEEKLPPLEVVPGAPPKGEKRPRPDLEETLVTGTLEPPSYEQALKEGASPYPMTKPIAPMARPVYGKDHKPVTLELPPPPTVPPLPAPSVGTVASAPAVVPAPQPAVRPVAVATARNPRGANWQSTLNSIVGLGVKTLKRRRCYY